MEQERIQQIQRRIDTVVEEVNRLQQVKLKYQKDFEELLDRFHNFSKSVQKYLDEANSAHRCIIASVGVCANEECLNKVCQIHREFHAIEMI